MKSLIAGLGLLVGAMLLPHGAARASGPALHIRDAKAAFEDLSAQDASWAALSETVLADQWLSFGALAPDFHVGLAAIKFGHDKTLSYHLLDLTAEMAPEYRLFAFGHMTHQGSDGAMEGLMVPAFFSSAPIGIYAVFGSDEDGGADSEALIEGLVDLLFGDMHGFVDAIFLLWMEEGAAHDTALDLFYWYCEVGAAFSGKVTDCDAALAELTVLFDQVKPFFGLMSLEQVHEMLDMLLDQPLVELIDLALTGDFAAFIGGSFEPAADFEVEVARIKQGPFADPEFWSFYDEIEDLGPGYALDQYEHRPPKGAWPYYDGTAVICGNVQSVMNFLPEEYAVVPGLIVDDLLWYDAVTEEKVSHITPAGVGSSLYASVRFFSALPFSGTVTGVVRKDMPGFGQEGDGILGEASVTVDIDPLEYVTTPRSILEIPFTADTDGALGVYVELRVEPEERPWFTTSWDHLWGAGDLFMARPLYWDNFGTYGHWPPSLPVVAPVLEGPGAALFVQARIAPAGPPIGGASVALTDGLEATAGAGGLAVFDWLPYGDVEILVEAFGYAASTPATETLAPGPAQWVSVFLHGIPELAPPEFAASTDCVPLTWDPGRFGGQVESFEVQPFDATDLEPVGAAADVPGGGAGEYCFDDAPVDGAVVLFRAVPTYMDGALGVEGDGPQTILDGSPPVVAITPVGFDEDPCVGSETTGLSIQAEDPHAPLIALAWSVDDGDWMELPPKTDETGHLIDAHLQVVEHLGATVRVRVTNAAGLETVSDPIEVPQAAAWCGVPEWGPEPTPEPSPEPDEDTVEAPPDLTDEVTELVAVAENEDDTGGGGGGSGCTTGDGPVHRFALLILFALLLGLRPRARPRQTWVRPTSS